ncbi:MAG TPA: hypothetical protein P5539_08905 [Mesotoga sp.]|nr:hypothetical protein [Mesotoga sp.]
MKFSPIQSPLKNSIEGKPFAFGSKIDLAAVNRLFGNMYETTSELVGKRREFIKQIFSMIEPYENITTKSMIDIARIITSSYERYGSEQLRLVSNPEINCSLISETLTAHNGAIISGFELEEKPKFSINPEIENGTVTQSSYIDIHFESKGANRFVMIETDDGDYSVAVNLFDENGISLESHSVVFSNIFLFNPRSDCARMTISSVLAINISRVHVFNGRPIPSSGHLTSAIGNFDDSTQIVSAIKVIGKWEMKVNYGSQHASHTITNEEKEIPVVTRDIVIAERSVSVGTQVVAGGLEGPVSNGISSTINSNSARLLAYKYDNGLSNVGIARNERAFRTYLVAQNPSDAPEGVSVYTPTGMASNGIVRGLNIVEFSKIELADTLKNIGSLYSENVEGFTIDGSSAIFTLSPDTNDVKLSDVSKVTPSSKFYVVPSCSITTNDGVNAYSPMSCIEVISTTNITASGGVVIADLGSPSEELDELISIGRAIAVVIADCDGTDEIALSKVWKDTTMKIGFESSDTVDGCDVYIFASSSDMSIPTVRKRLNITCSEEFQMLRLASLGELSNAMFEVRDRDGNVIGSGNCAGNVMLTKKVKEASVEILPSDMQLSSLAVFPLVPELYISDVIYLPTGTKIADIDFDGDIDVTDRFGNVIGHTFPMDVPPYGVRLLLSEDSEATIELSAISNTTIALCYTGQNNFDVSYSLECQSNHGVVCRKTDKVIRSGL